MFRNKMALRLLRPSDLLLPLAFLVASLVGRGEVALELFIVLYVTKLCALATADGLRAAYATQPSMKYVQGSTLTAFACQFFGIILACLIFYLIPGMRPLLPLAPCGLLLNIEHVFYEYLCAVGDKKSALASRSITAVLTLLGLQLCMPPHNGPFVLTSVDPIWPLITCGLSALVELFISVALGGRFHPVPNVEVFRRAPLSMVHAALCPALILVALNLLWPASFTPSPVFAGLLLHEACRTPFRRAPLESKDMNRLLLIVVGAAASGLIIFQFLVRAPLSDAVAMTCAALLIAALCSFALYGSVAKPE